MAHPTNKHERVLLGKEDRSKDSILNSNHWKNMKRKAKKMYNKKIRHNEDMEDNTYRKYVQKHFSMEDYGVVK